MGIMRRFIAKKQKLLFSALSSSPPPYTRLSDDVDSTTNRKARKGYVPVMVGEHIGMRERFLIPTHLISHPAILSLLESSAKEFEYSQQGVIQITQDPNRFREILRSLTSNKISVRGIRPNNEDFVFFGGYLCM